MTPLDDLLAATLADTAHRLSTGGVSLSALREKDLSVAFAGSARSHFRETVQERRTVKLWHFPRVGGADIAGLSADGELVFLAELKWSYCVPDKIFEAAWDAVKLALAREQFGLKGAWLVTGAPIASWAATECAELFTDGDVNVRELWDRAMKPRSPNRGETVGDDCEIGGRGLMFTHAPQGLRVRVVSQEVVVHNEEAWKLRAVDVKGVGPPLPFVRRIDPKTLGTPPAQHTVGSDFPRRITQRWLERNVPHLPGDEFQRLLETLKARNWSDGELDAFVFPLQESSATSPPVSATLGGSAFLSASPTM